MSQTSTINVASAPVATAGHHTDIRGHGRILVDDSDRAFSLPPANERKELSKAHSTGIITNLSGITVVSSLSTGLLTVGLPRMAKDVNLAPNLLLW